MQHKKLHKSMHNGFTLIELLVVLAIIGILIALAVIGLNAARAQQRDTARKEIVQQINAQLQSWQSNNGTYPTKVTFYGAVSATTDFIYTGATCANGGVTVNGQCLGLDSLALNIGNNSVGCATVPSVTAANVTLCYDPTSGSQGYTLATFLESGTTYFAAQ